MCLYPTIIKNPKYKLTVKNGGKIPPVIDERTRLLPVGCGDCIECRKQKARAWQVRLLEDIKKHRNGKFITLTFSNEKYTEIWDILKEEGVEAEGYELDNAIAIKAMRMFNERWRKKTGKALRHWMVTELGHEGTENIHLHGIVWTDATYAELKEKWGNGFIWGGTYVNARTVNYMMKYVTKRDLDHKAYKSRILTSPGIGASYMERGDWKKNLYTPDGGTQETYRTDTGHKIAMPTYWRNKIYSEEEREKLWIEKIEKGKRWVCGEEVKDNTEEYYKLLEFHRKKNRELGYGNGQIEWSREQYERSRRIIIQKARIKKKVTPSG